MTTYNPNTTITNGGYQTSSGTVSTVTLNGANNGWITNGIGVTGTITGAPNTNFHNGNGTPLMSIPYNENKVVVEEKAALEVKGSIVLNGECLNERIERIETLLNIPTRDITMEDKYPKLKELWAEYNRELAKYKTWDALKNE